MRKLVVTTFVSLDGVMQAPGGSDEDRRGGFEHGGWSFQFWSEDSAKFKYDELFATGAILLGRFTYEIFAAYWPTQTDEEMLKMIKVAGGNAEAMQAMAGKGDPFANRMNTLPKYVVSTTLKSVDWNNSTLIKGDLATEINKLKQQPGQDIVVHGSGDLANSLIQLDLVDELRLMTFPVVLGSGKHLLQPGLNKKVLRLVDTKPFKSGVVVLTYEPLRK